MVFDGDCVLCAGGVAFVRARSAAGTFRFAARDTPPARAELTRYPLAAAADALVLIEAGRAYTGSDAALRIAGRMRPPWPALGLLRWVPHGLREGAYRIMARNRYRWFGRLTND